MAEFKQAFELTIAHEGGYVNDPDDPGGETYKGVARKIHSNWDGWQTIDWMKSQPGFPENINKYTDLLEAIADFYRVNFWDKIKGDAITNQKVAESIFDFAVNAGVETSSLMAQSIVGAGQDGNIGPDSIKKINAFDPDHFIAAFTVAKIGKYIRIVKKRPQSSKYFYGWVCRALGE